MALQLALVGQNGLVKMQLSISILCSANQEQGRETQETFDMRLGYISVRTPYSYMDLNIKSTNTN